jgi:tRNA threonylcarbamoyladenosine biosynthesis protein TsaE
MRHFEFLAKDEQDTERLGEALAQSLPERAAIGLCGTLGAGKTRLVQGVAAACGVNRADVVSPTFVLCQHYYGTAAQTIHHLDAYRIRDEDEWAELGTSELLAQPGWVFLEWADRFPDALPRERLQIQIEVTGETSRRFVLTAHGAGLERTLDSLRSSLERKQL